MVYLKRIRELDGIRGIAISLVVIFHYRAIVFFNVNMSALEKAIDRIAGMGWLGVDVFFVLSGFLITGILLKREPSRYFWKVFYLRRAARILPLFFCVFLLTLVCFKTEASKTAILMYLLFLGNWTVAIGKEVPALGYLWSLAIEEQFYLFWPSVVRKFDSYSLLLAALALASLSILLRFALFVMGVNAYTIYKITPTRLDGLTLGAALAISLQTPTACDFLRRYSAHFFAAAVIIVCGGFVYLKFSFFSWDPRSVIIASPAVGILTAVCIYRSVNTSLPLAVSRALSNSILIWLGKRSYGIYLIHEALHTSAIVILSSSNKRAHSQLLTNMIVAIVAFVASLLLAELSWKIIEAPSMSAGANFADAIVVGRG